MLKHAKTPISAESVNLSCKQSNKNSGTNAASNHESKQNEPAVQNKRNNEQQQDYIIPPEYAECKTLQKSRKKQVYSAIHNHAPVVVKICTQGTEMEILSGFPHPHIAPLASTWTTGTHYAIVMPKYQPYNEYFDKRKIKPALKLVAISAIQLFSALSHLHKHGVYYGDVSLNNVMFHSSNGVVLTDFDLSGYIADIRKPSHFGTGIFVAPELNNKDKYSEKIDVYSAGVLIAEWLRYCLVKTESSTRWRYSHFSCSLRSEYKSHDSILLPLMAVIHGCTTVQQERYSCEDALRVLHAFASQFQPDSTPQVMLPPALLCT